MSETQQQFTDQNNEWAEKIELKSKIESLVKAETNLDFKTKLQWLVTKVEENFEKTDLANLRKIIKEYMNEHFDEEQKKLFLKWVEPIIIAGLERALSNLSA